MQGLQRGCQVSDGAIFSVFLLRPRGSSMLREGLFRGSYPFSKKAVLRENIGEDRDGLFLRWFPLFKKGKYREREKQS